MSGAWGGSASVVVSATRWVHPRTGRLVLEDAVPEGRAARFYKHVVVTFVFEGSASHTPGRLTGPWEDSFPSDDDCTIDGWTCTHATEPTLEDEEAARSALWESCRDDDHYDDDRAADAWERRAEARDEGWL